MFRFCYLSFFVAFFGFGIPQVVYGLDAIELSFNNEVLKAGQMEVALITLPKAYEPNSNDDFDFFLFYSKDENPPCANISSPSCLALWDQARLEVKRMPRRFSYFAGKHFPDHFHFFVAAKVKKTNELLFSKIDRVTFYDKLGPNTCLPSIYEGMPYQEPRLNTSIEADLWVSVKDGKDSNPGTKNLPFRSIARGIEVLRNQFVRTGKGAGRTLMVREGTYLERVKLEEQVLTSWGLANKPVRILGYPGEEVVISPPIDWANPKEPVFPYSALSISNIEHLHFENFTILANGSHMVVGLGELNDLTFQNNRVYSEPIPYDGKLKVSTWAFFVPKVAVSDLKIYWNRFMGLLDEHQVYISALRGNRIEVIGNLMHGAGRHLIQINGGALQDVAIRQNVLWGADMGAIRAIFTCGLNISRNLMDHVNQPSIGLSSYFDTHYYSTDPYLWDLEKLAAPGYITVDNNTIVRRDKALIKSLNVPTDNPAIIIGDTSGKQEIHRYGRTDLFQPVYPPHHLMITKNLFYSEGASNFMVIRASDGEEQLRKYVAEEGIKASNNFFYSSSAKPATISFDTGYRTPAEYFTIAQLEGKFPELWRLNLSEINPKFHFLEPFETIDASQVRNWHLRSYLADPRPLLSSPARGMAPLLTEFASARKFEDLADMAGMPLQRPLATVGALESW